MLRLRAGDSTAGVRMDAENIHAYLDLLRSVYDEFGFDDHPEQIHNMDETGVPLEPRPPKIVAAKGAEKDLVLYFRTEITNYTHWLWECYWPDSSSFHYFHRETVKYTWTNKEVSGSRYAVSDKGWVDQCSAFFFYWLKKHFLQNAISQCPLLDGYSSHFEPNSIQFTKDNEVIIFCLPPHT